MEASSSWQQKPWQPFQKTWGQQTWSQRGSGSSSKWNQGWGQQREKGWNKWPKKDEGRDWAKPDPKNKPPEGGEVFAAAPTAPEEDPYQVAVATKEEEEGFHAHLWQEATQQALADPDRPLCVRELVKNGRLTAWWSMSWKDARAQINGALVDEYRGLLQGYFVGPPKRPGTLPEPVLVQAKQQASLSS